ncbi:MAG: type III pantothenate kinase [Verrucomicrobiaceae bacterium]|nr:type III pantothenate kinase [Verrucomicrobiaceae bacterium]
MSTSTAAYLLINNNNTRTKFALACGGELLEHRSLASRDVTADSVAALLADWRYDFVVLASVVPANVPALVASQSGRELVEVSHRIPLGVAIDFPEPAKIGADRLANAVAVARRRFDGPVIVVDFGTAVTFDIIDRRPAYIGGVIAPGLDAMRHYLHQKTALLPKIDLARPDTAIGKTTVHAMQSGAFHGYRGLVKEILQQIEGEMGETAKVIATGGYAGLIAEGLPMITSVEPYLTMQGLLHVAHLNFTP